MTTFGNQLKTIVLLGVLSAGFVGLGGLLGPRTLTLFAGLAVLMNFAAYFWSDKLVLRMHRAEEVSRSQAPRLHELVEGVCRTAGIPKPRLYVIPELQPNAFATGRNPRHAAVAVTEGLLRMLNERELRGVLAHELAHVRNRDILIATIAAAVATAVTYVANALQWSALLGGGRDDDERGSPWGALLVAIVAPIGATIIQLAISRAREFEADATAARLTGDPEGLASALAKLQRGAESIPADVAPATASLFIVSPLAGGKRGAFGGFAKLFSTHPDMGERIRRLRELRTRAAA